MSDDTKEAPDNIQGELDKEHAFAGLDQTIGDREQALEDVEQKRLDDSQATLDHDDLTAPPGDRAGRLQRAHRQREQGMAQARRDAHQEQLDKGQGGRDRRQSFLDVQQQQLEDPTADEPANSKAALAAAGDERVRLANERAGAARRRASEAAERAEEAEERAAALLRRSGDTP
jgi:hypothetical protein